MPHASRLLAPLPPHVHGAGRRALRAVLTAAALAGALAAQAAKVSGQFDFTATALSNGAPLDPVSGVVSFSFDNAATFFNAADGALVNGAVVDVRVIGINLPGTWTPALTYLKSGIFFGLYHEDVLALGHALSGTVVNAGTDDWRISFNAASVQPSFREFTYASAGSPGLLFTTSIGQVSAVPEPASMLTMGMGLAALLVGWRGRTA